MKIVSFEMHDADGWTLEPVKLDAFNLLVGVSGAGKTRIVRAIERVCAVALGTTETERFAHEARGSRFAIELEHDGAAYQWTAEMEPQRWQENGATLADEPLIRSERIMKGEETLVHRTPDSFVFKGQTLPRLDRSRSAIAMLKEDPAATPLHVAFSRCIFRELNVMPSRGLNGVAPLPSLPPRYASVEELGADLSLSLHDKAEQLQQLFPEALAEIADAFREGFPLVEDLEVGRVVPWQDGLPAQERKLRMYPVLVVKESGVASAVRFDEMSSGMQRYLAFLVHLSYAPRGTVVLIDELEAHFGINCLPAATRFLLSRAPDLQLILTSHHPYIIQQIPIACWKLVTRKGSHVRVLDAAAIPALEEARSRLDRFTRLINLPEYVQGIQA